MRVTDPDRLRRARLHKDWTQEIVAAACKKSKQSIHMVESGQRDTIDEQFAADWARALELPMEEVLAPLPPSRTLSSSTRVSQNIDEVTS